VSRSLVLLSALAAGAAATPAFAADLAVSFELPRLTVAEYHKPYVAIWLERPDTSAVATLSVWYETEREEHGQKYLKELRQWWRKAGREMTLPVDGVSGATRAPGPQRITFDGAKSLMSAAPAGPYNLVIEVSREAGGHEIVRMPIFLPLKKGKSGAVAGASELGAVRFTVK
jgi:hypothetical protein